LDRHVVRKHSKSDFSERCLLCNEIFFDANKLQVHLITKHGPSAKFYEKESAFDSTVMIYRLTYDTNQTNFNNGQTEVIDNVKETLRFEAAKKSVVKASLIYICQMSMVDYKGEKVQTTLIPFRSSSFVTNAFKNSGLTAKIVRSFREQENAFDEFCESGSGWTFDRAVAFDIEISAIKPLVIGGVSKGKNRLNINGLKNKKFLFNPNNRDHKCFLRCIFFLLTKSEVESKFVQWEKTLNLKDIVFPISMQSIRKFVKQNRHLKIKLNILFRTLKGEIFPFECGIGSGDNNVNLLMIENTKQTGDRYVSERHFLAIKNVNKFLTTHYDGEKRRCYSKSLFCVNCFNRFSLKSSLEKHEQICLLNKPVKETLQTGDIEFENHNRKHFQDYIAFLDFECALSPDSKLCSDCNSLRCKCDKSFTEIVSHQEPIAYCFIILNGKNEIIHEKTYAGENAADHFINHLMECHEEWIGELLSTCKPMVISPREQEMFDMSLQCYLCDRLFTDQIKCRDHNHYTGRYLGAACQDCNLNRQKEKRMPIFLHNGSKYDFHFIIQALNRKDVGNIRVLPYNGEHFRTISFKGFKFVDSLAFLQASLAQLSSDLSNTDHNYDILKQTWLVETDGKFDFIKFKTILQKSFFPYEFCESLQQMENTKALPPPEKFYSSLSESSISETDYLFAQSVWKMFDCENLVDYTKIYCMIDTLLLAEIFQKFRKDMIAFSGLDPSYYISLPAYAFDSMLKITECKLQKMQDIDMIHFVESSIRGGVSFINTKYLEADTSSNEEIVYIDANVSSVNKLVFFKFILIMIFI